MRDSLDHCVKCTICETYCPVANVTPLFPGPKYVGPQAERFRAPGEPRPTTRWTTARAAGSARRFARRACTSPRSTRRRARSCASAPACKLRDRLIARPTLAGRLGTPVAPIANATLKQPAAADRRREDGRAAPRCRDAAVRRAHVPGLGAQAPLARGRAPRRVLPRLRGELLRARSRAHDGRAARAQRRRGRGPQAGLLRAAAAVQRPVRRRAQVRAPARASGSRRSRGRASTSSARRRAAR